MAEKKEGFSKYAGRTFLIGFGFFTMGLMDTLYDTFLPKFLGQHISSKAIVGGLMSLDNLLAIFLIPLVAVWSDRARTPLGRRMPFIIVLLPLSAIAFSAIPYVASSLLWIVILVLVLNLFKQSVRGPVIALMPDLTPADLRSEANGVINTMGGIAAIVATLFLAKLMDLKAVLPVLGQTQNRISFPIAGALIIIATLMLLIFIREKKMSAEVGNAPEEKPAPFFESFKKVQKEGGSAFLVLVALFLWFLGYQGVVPFIGVYANETLGVSTGSMGFGMGAVGVAYAIFAVPSGYLAHRIGRKKTIRIALAALVVVSLCIAAFDFAFRGGFLPKGSGFIIYLGILFFFGVFWVSIVTNSFPMLWQMAKQDTMGIYTGLYYTFSQLAAILAPSITGAIIDGIRAASKPGAALKDIPSSAGYWGMFVFCAACMAAAFIVMHRVNKGEPTHHAEQAA
jgi:maltose/moltooligosaccharide transporter